MIDKNKVKDLALEWLEGKEYFLVDATVDEQNKITVEIDHKDGVWIEDCCELSRLSRNTLTAMWRILNWRWVLLVSGNLSRCCSSTSTLSAMMWN